jgi:hypothetical protein
MHLTGRLIKLVVSLAFLVAVMSTAAAAAQSSGAVLSKVEYQQLRAMQVGTSSALSGHHSSLKNALPVCRRAAGVSALLRASKARCAALVHYAIGDLNVVSATLRCTKLKTVKTEVEALSCLAPSFSAFSGDSETLLLSTRRVANIATGRKFKSSCVAALGGAKSDLRLLGEFATDLRVLVAAMRAHNLGLFEVAGKRVSNLEGALKSVRSPGSLSICPHQ